MSLRLPRLNIAQSIVGEGGKPVSFFQRFWQSFAESIEEAFGDIADAASAATDAQAAADAAAASAAAAQVSADGAITAAGSAQATADGAQSGVDALEARQIISGAGLTGGGDLTADRTLDIGAGDGITVNADDIALTVPTAFGTYTPTLNNTTNISASTAYECQYMRVGDCVTVSGRVDITPTASPAATTLRMSLPIASDFAGTQNCGGTASTLSVSGEVIAINADSTNDEARFQWTAGTTGAFAYQFSFMYRII